MPNGNFDLLHFKKGNFHKNLVEKTLVNIMERKGLIFMS